MDVKAYRIDKPYPQVTGLSENRRVGRMLLNSYGGAVSETTAANQYLYHYLLSLGEYAPVSEALYAIADVERQHLLLLGLCIRQLGVDPKFRTIDDGSPRYWSSRNVAYGDTVKDMLLADIRHEERTIRQYEALLKRLSNTQVQALIARIQEDEQLHLRILTDLYNRYF